MSARAKPRKTLAELSGMLLKYGVDICRRKRGARICARSKDHRGRCYYRMII